MERQAMVERFFEILITGDRPTARRFVAEAESELGRAEALVTEVFWPTYELIQKLHREDHLQVLNYNFATRLLRWLVDQNAAKLRQAPRVNRSVFAMCGQSEGEELGAQMAIDLLEGAGFDVNFAGGGVANDEVLARVQDEKPDVLLAFCSAASDLPSIRSLIDTLHEIGACPNLQFAVGGGVFNRAEGLAEEIGADVWASHPLELVESLVSAPNQRANESQRTVGRTRRTKAKAA
ncbi:MAG: cobalamin B12-binding domain-containing protein [Phycisphaeraceae bacterium]|nr:cobalamin B12-binding domain-containing protein [Phycisphaeraceae bacterium]